MNTLFLWLFVIKNSLEFYSASLLSLFYCFPTYLLPCTSEPSITWLFVHPDCLPTAVLTSIVSSFCEADKQNKLRQPQYKENVGTPVRRNGHYFWHSTKQKIAMTNAVFCEHKEAYRNVILNTLVLWQWYITNERVPVVRELPLSMLPKVIPLQLMCLWICIHCWSF